MRLPLGAAGVLHHFVDVGGTEILARVAEFLHAAFIADIRVVDDEVRGLIFLVLGAGVVEVGELVEGQLAVAFGGTEQVGFVAAIGGLAGERLQVLVTGVRRQRVAAGPPLKIVCRPVLKMPAIMPFFESLMEVAHRPEFVLDPAGFDAAAGTGRGWPPTSRP